MNCHPVYLLLTRTLPGVGIRLNDIGSGQHKLMQAAGHGLAVDPRGTATQRDTADHITLITLDHIDTRHRFNAL